MSTTPPKTAYSAYKHRFSGRHDPFSVSTACLPPLPRVYHPTNTETTHSPPRQPQTPMQITANEPIRCEATTAEGTRCQRRAVVWRIARGVVLTCCAQHDRMGYPVPFWDMPGLRGTDKDVRGRWAVPHNWDGNLVMLLRSLCLRCNLMPCTAHRFPRMPCVTTRRHRMQSAR
mgnify:CR=1 FL=1